MNNNKRKTIIFFFILFLLNFLLNNFVILAISKYTNLDLKLKEINPINPKASDLVKITFLVYNDGTKEAKVSLNILNQSYFYFIGLNKEEINIPPKSYTEVSAYLKIKDNTTSGNYPLIVNLIEKENVYSKKTYEFFLKIVNPSHIEISSSDSANCKINDYCFINLLIINKGYSKVKNLVIKSNLPSESLVIDKLDPNKNYKKKLKVFIPENLNPGLFGLKLDYSYLDEENNLIEGNINIPINLLSNVDLSISSFFVDKEKKLLKIKVENPGEGKAKNILLNLKINNQSKNYYLTYLDENEDSTLFIDLSDFYLTKNNKVIIQLTWFDYTNKSKRYEFNFSIYKENKESNILVALIIASILAVVVLIIKMKVRKNEN